MKRFLLPTLTCSAVLLTSGYLLGQNKAKSATTTASSTPATQSATPGKQQKLVKVATLNDVQANREFQTNVQVMQTQRQLAVDLNAAIEKEKDAKKKKELKTQLDTLLAKLNENNQTMIKTYGFSLDRNYTLEIEKAHIYMFVTDEEAARFEKAQKEAKK